jgi:predicted GNAT family acetyltransferase
MEDQAVNERGNLRIEDDREQSRFEVFVDEVRAGFTDYHSQPGLITLLDTEIDPAFEGRGIGTRFVAGVLDEIRARDARVLPICPFVRAFLQRHPEYADLVART